MCTLKPKEAWVLCQPWGSGYLIGVRGKLKLPMQWLKMVIEYKAAILEVVDMQLVYVAKWMLTYVVVENGFCVQDKNITLERFVDWHNTLYM